jgi:hypothetical protein
LTKYLGIADWLNRSVAASSVSASRIDNPKFSAQVFIKFGGSGSYPQRHLPPIPPRRPSRHGEPGVKAMTEVVMALCVFFSISVFLAHAFDAYRAR